MDKREADFHAKLLETFKIESDEHLKSISVYLLELEEKPSKEKEQELVEIIFREAHSLKGAARSVNLNVIQNICQSLEDVLALWKENKIHPTPELFETVYTIIDFLTKFISVPNQPVNEEQLNLLVNRLDNLKVIKEDEIECSPPKKAKKASTTSAHGNTKTVRIPKNLSKTPNESTLTKNQNLEQLVEKQITTAKSKKQTKEKPSKLTEPDEKKPTITQNITEITPKTNSSQTVSPEHHAHESKGKTIRISVDKLDKLFQQVEEMLIIKLTAGQCITDLKTVQRLLKQWDKEWSQVQPEILSHKTFAKQIQNKQLGNKERNFPQSGRLLEFMDWQVEFIKSLHEIVNKLSKNTSQDNRVIHSMVDSLLDETKKVLMQPFSTILEVFPRMVRDISHSLEKEVHLITEGDSIEIDRRILEEMKDPLIHLIRNCIDHGIELPEQRLKNNKAPYGTLKISASQFSGSSIELTISDDGQGIDFETVKASALKKGLISPLEVGQMSPHEILMLVFQSGVSTSPIITDLSGRGLGLGIVSEKVEKLGGQIYLETKENVGTTIRIILPSTLATFRGIHIKVSDQDFIIPTHSVKRIIRIKSETIKTVENRETIFVDNRTLSLVSLADILGISEMKEIKTVNPFRLVAIIKAAEVTVAFSIDRVFSEQEVFVKGLGNQLQRVRNISAATVMEWGKVIPILDPFDLVKSVTKNPYFKSVEKSTEVEIIQKSILIVEDSVTARMLLKNILESAGYNVKTAVDGAEGYSFLKNEKVDLVLSDVEMPRMDGFELTAKLRSIEEFKDLPIVLCTSRGSREDREHGIEVGANAYIDKSSFAQSNLLDIIKKLL